MSEKPRRTIAIITGVVFAVGLALFVFQFLGRGADAPLLAPELTVELTPELTVELHHGETPIRTLRTATPGDRLVVKAKAASAVWLYLDGETLLASCPGDPRCAQQGADLQLELTLETPGEYRAVLLHGRGAPPAPSSSLKADLAAARSAGFSVLAATPVHVR